MLDVTGSTDYEYDLAGRLTSVTTEQGGTIRYGYDVYGNITSLTYPDGAVVYYAYDALDRMVSITGRDGNTTYYSYDANGNMTKVTRPNDTFTDIVYDAEGRIVKLSNVKADGKIISDFSYTYDKSGYIIEEIARQDGMVVTTSYTYDNRGQLTEAVSVNAEYTLKTEYSYDLAGNRITEKVSKTQWGTTSVLTDLTNTYDANNRLIKQTNTAASWTRSITYTYDENGNMVRKDTPDSSYTIYEYDSENRLTAVHDGGSLLFAALYDGNGDRVFSVAPRQNTGNWHDDWNDGRWEVAEPQNDYNDTQWTYGEESEPETTEPPVTEPVETEPAETEVTEPEVTDPVESEPSESEPDATESTTSGDDGSWWPGKYEGGDTGVDDGLWDPDGSESTEPTESTEATEATEATEPESSEPDTSGIPAWDSATTYLGGDQVIYNGCIYEARWWTLGDIPGAVNEGPWKLISVVTVPEVTEPVETEPVETEPEATEPAEAEPDTSFEVNGSADYDYSLIQDILYVPNGIDTAYEEENYLLTGYINDINTAYTQVLVEYGTTGTYDSVYEYGVQRTTMYQNSQVYSYEYDGRGSVSELVNTIGETQIKYSYGAYGETVSTVIGWNNPVTNPYRYNAERIDDVAGVPAFQYLRARYLNPYTATFLTQDTYLGQLTEPLSQNRYLYVAGNPLNYIDPSGHFFSWLFDWINNYKDNKDYEELVREIEAYNQTLVRYKVDYDNAVNETEKTEIAEKFNDALEKKTALYCEALELQGRMLLRGKTDFLSLPDALIFTLNSIEISTTAPLIAQENKVWCWVASAEMMVSARVDIDSEWTQSRISRDILGYETDDEGYRLENGEPYLDGNGKKVYSFGSLQNVIDVAEMLTNSTYQFYPEYEAISEDEIRRNILLNYPVAIHWGLYNKNDAFYNYHIAVIVGYNSETGNYLINDPWAVNVGSVYELSYDELIKHTDADQKIRKWEGTALYCEDWWFYDNPLGS